MFEGNTFLGATGIPILKIARVKTRLAVWLPDPLTVAAWIVRLLIICSVTSFLGGGLRMLRVCWNEQGPLRDRGWASRGSASFPLQSSSCEGRRPQGACSR